MDIATKNEIHGNLSILEQEIKDMGAAYRATTKALATLAIVRDEILEGDVLFACCEECEEPIWESLMDTATSTDDAWVCAACIKRWNP